MKSTWLKLSSKLRYQEYCPLADAPRQFNRSMRFLEFDLLDASIRPVSSRPRAHNSPHNHHHIKVHVFIVPTNPKPPSASPFIFQVRSYFARSKDDVYKLAAVECGSYSLEIRPFGATDAYNAMSMKAFWWRPGTTPPSPWSLACSYRAYWALYSARCSFPRWWTVTR